MAKLPLPSLPPLTAKKSGLQSTVAPVSADAVYERTDQGVDYTQSTPYVAVGAGTIIGVTTGWTGSGTGIGLYYRLDKPIVQNGRTYRDLYVAETTPVKNFQAGDRVAAGEPLMSGGAAELGFANGTSPVAPLVGGKGAGTQPTQAGADFLAFAKGGHVPLTPAAKAAAAAADAAAKAGSPGYNAATAAASVAQSTATLQAQAKSGAYLAAVEAKAAATATARATAHQSDPWVTVVTDKKTGKVTGFGEAIGQSPPNNTLLIGGMPATRSDYQLAWSNTYANVYEAYTGKVATPDVQAKILESGVSVYGLQQQLASQPTFSSSPVYKSQGAGIAEQARQALGKQPPASFVRDAIAQNWDANTTAAKIRELPGYSSGPDFQANHAAALSTYQTIYGEPTPEANQWLKHAAIQGWSSTEVGAKLRADPAYKYSPEYQTKAVNFLDAMGMFTGTRAIAGVQPEQIVKQNTKGTKVGATSDLQVGVSGQ